MSEKWVHGRKPGAGVAKAAWKNGIFLNVNGGEGKLASATIPIEWKFSPAMIAEQPQYVVIVDQEFSFFELRRQYQQTYDRSTRHEPIPVTKFAKYLQLRKSGNHHIIVMVFCGTPEHALNNAQSYVAGNPCGYRHTITLEHIKNGRLGDGWDAYLSTFSIVVPDELLSHAPKSGWRKVQWDWANRWYKKGPVDDCDYDKRCLYSYIFQPIPFLIGRVCYGVFMTLYTLLGSMLLAFGGWKPINPFKNIWRSWFNYPRSTMHILMNKRWRDWANEYSDYYSFIPLWKLPVLYTAGITAVVMLLRALKLHRVELLIVLGIVTGAALLIGTLTLMETFVKSSKGKTLSKQIVSNFKRLYHYLKETRKTRKEDREQKRREKHLTRLGAILAPAGTPATQEKVNIGTIIKRADPATGAKLVFWAVKSKSCKPFAH